MSLKIKASCGFLRALTEASKREVDSERNERKTTPDLNAIVNDVSLEEEPVGTAVHEVEEPLLGRLGPVVPNVSSGVTRLLVEVFLAIPSTVLHLGYSETLAVDESHILHVSIL